MKMHLLAVLASVVIILGLFRGSLAFNGTPSIYVPCGYDQYNNPLPMQFDIYGPNNWHYSGYSFSYCFNEPTFDISASHFQVPFFDGNMRTWIDLPSDGNYRCVGCFNLTGETHEETKYIAYDPEHPMGLNGAFEFKFGTLMNPVQVGSDSYELGTKPTWTSEEQVNQHGAGNGVWSLGTWLMLKNITCYEAMYRILNIGTGISGVSMTLDYFKAHIVTAFADAIGLSTVYGLVDVDKIFVPVYVSYRILGETYCDGNFPCGFHGQQLSWYSGPAFAVVIDEMIGQCAWFGHDTGNYETGAAPANDTMNLFELADEMLHGALGSPVAGDMNTTDSVIGMPMGVSGRDSPIPSQRLHYTGTGDMWSGVSGPVPWDNCYILHGVPDNGGFPMMPQWGSGNVIPPIVIPPIIYLPIVGNVPTLVVVFGGASIVAAVAIVIVLVRKRHA